MINHILFVLALSWGLLAAMAVRAEQAVLQFGVLNLVPYGFQDKGQPVRGYLYDIAVEMLQRSAVPHQVHLMPLPRLFRDIRKGAVDCMFIADVPATRAMAVLSEPVGVILRGGILPGPTTDIVTFDDVYRYEIGVPAGVSFYPRFDDESKIRKTRVPHYKSAVDMLLGGRVDAVIGNIDAFAYYARRKGLDPATAFSPPLILQNSPMKLACSKTAPSAATDKQALETTLRAMRQGGFVRDILSEYDSLDSFDHNNDQIN